LNSIYRIAPNFLGLIFSWISWFFENHENFIHEIFRLKVWPGRSGYALQNSSARTVCTCIYDLRDPARRLKRADILWCKTHSWNSNVILTWAKPAAAAHTQPHPPHHRIFWVWLRVWSEFTNFFFHENFVMLKSIQITKFLYHKNLELYGTLSTQLFEHT
jgi:hypothetical protein